jgi:dihydroorotate dehydrogenase (NAD+) catalytic subunit
VPAAVEARGPAVDPLGGRPVSLAVDLGRGLELETPILAAAGTFGYGAEYAELVDLDRGGAVVTRSVTRKPRTGNAPPRIAETPGGLLNGIGIQNPGIDAVLERYEETWRTWRVPVILNVAGGSVEDYVDVVRRIEGASGVAGVELNLACPNAARGGTLFALDVEAAASLVTAVRRATELPVIVKLSPAASDVRSIARAVEDAGADAISAVNTLPGLAVAADRAGLRLGSGYGGVSGPALRPIALRVVYEVAQGVDIPVIGIGGIGTLDDVLDFLAVGASAVAVGTAVLADPMVVVRLADELADACRERGMASVDLLVGTALPKRPANPSSRGAEYRP